MDRGETAFWIAPIVVMVIGLLPMPFGYYTLSRLVVCGCAAYFAFKLYQKQETIFLWGFGLLAVLYNPIIPIHLYDKEIWMIVNAASAFMFFLKRKEIS